MAEHSDGLGESFITPDDTWEVHRLPYGDTVLGSLRYHRFSAYTNVPLGSSYNFVDYPMVGPSDDVSLRSVSVRDIIS